MEMIKESEAQYEEYILNTKTERKTIIELKKVFLTIYKSMQGD